MNAQEVGIYVLLLCMDWNGGGITFNPRLLARYCRVSEEEFLAAWEAVGQCFVERDGKLWNPRLEREREKQGEFRERQRNAANKRWESQRNATALPVECSPTPSPSPTPRTTTTAAPDATAMPRDTFGNADQHTAYLRVRGAARSAVSFDAQLRAIQSGMHGPAYDWPIIGAALVEMDAVGANPSAQAIRAFCQKLDAAAKQQAMLKEALTSDHGMF